MQIPDVFNHNVRKRDPILHAPRAITASLLTGPRPIGTQQELVLQSLLGKLKPVSDSQESGSPVMRGDAGTLVVYKSSLSLSCSTPAWVSAPSTPWVSVG